MCACAPTSVEVLGFFCLLTAMRTDCFAHCCSATSVSMLTAAVRILTALIYNFVPIIQFLIFPHRPNSSPMLTAIPFGAHAQCAPNALRICTECAPPFYSVPMLTNVGEHMHRNQRCTFGEDAHRRRWKFYPLSVSIAHRLSTLLGLLLTNRIQLS